MHANKERQRSIGFPPEDYAAGWRYHQGFWNTSGWR